jgi:hypothetical protein
MAIDVDHGFSGTSARMLVCGEDNTDPATKRHDRCSTKTIANPDDVAMIPEYRQLMIGEDTRGAERSVCEFEHQPDSQLTYQPSGDASAQQQIHYAEMTWAAAKDWCGRHSDCVAFGFDSPQNKPMTPVPVYFDTLTGHYGGLPTDENSGSHTYVKKCNRQSKSLWVYDLVIDGMTRVASVPNGAETASPFWFTVGHWSYVSLVAQHPEVAQVGYLGPFPVRPFSPVALWREIPYPVGTARSKLTTAPIVTLSDIEETGRIGFHVLHRSNKLLPPNTVIGTIVTKSTVTSHRYVYETDVGGSPTSTELVSQDPDFSSILNIGDKIFSVTQYTSEHRTGVAYLSELEQDSETGKLTVTQTKPVDFSAHGGVWAPRAGTVTPWETHLGAEQNEPDARAFYDDDLSVDDVSEFLRYFGEYVNPDAINLAQATQKGFFPYRYGYAWETEVSADFTEKTTKLYALGRR